MALPTKEHLFTVERMNESCYHQQLLQTKIPRLHVLPNTLRVFPLPHRAPGYYVYTEYHQISNFTTMTSTMLTSPCNESVAGNMQHPRVGA